MKYEEDFEGLAREQAEKSLVGLGWPPDAVSEEDVDNFLSVDQRYHRPMWFLGKAHKKALEQFRWTGGNWDDVELELEGEPKMKPISYEPEVLNDEEREIKKQQDIHNQIVEMKTFFAGLSSDDLVDEDIHFAIDDMMNDYSSLRWGDEYEEHMAAMRVEHEREEYEIKRLKTQIKSGFQLPDGCPPLPFRNPEGTLFGIGIGYDEDNDDRVIVAAAKLGNYFAQIKGGNYVDTDDIVALYEHEGGLNIFTLDPITQAFGDMSDIEVCGDTWSVTQYVPCGPLGWVAVTPKYIWDCVKSTLAYDRVKFSNERSNFATKKQLGFLRGLGYTGPSEISKSKASDLIDEYKSKKEAKQ